MSSITGQQQPWLHQDLIIDQDALERIFRAQNDTSQDFNEFESEVRDASQLRLQQILEPWLTNNVTTQSHRLSHRATARLLSFKDLTRIWKPSQNVIIPGDGYLRLLDYDSSEILQILSDLIHINDDIASRARVILNTREADDLRSQVAENLAAETSIADLTGSLLSSSDHRSRIANFCQKHPFYQNASPDQSSIELYAYLDDIAMICNDLGLSDVKNIVANCHKEYNTIKKWLMSRRSSQFADSQDNSTLESRRTSLNSGLLKRKRTFDDDSFLNRDSSVRSLKRSRRGQASIDLSELSNQAERQIRDSLETSVPQEVTSTVPNGIASEAPEIPESPQLQSPFEPKKQTSRNLSNSFSPQVTSTPKENPPHLTSQSNAYKPTTQSVSRTTTSHDTSEKPMSEPQESTFASRLAKTVGKIDEAISNHMQVAGSSSSETESEADSESDDDVDEEDEEQDEESATDLHEIGVENLQDSSGADKNDRVIVQSATKLVNAQPSSPVSAEEEDTDSTVEHEESEDDESDSSEASDEEDLEEAATNDEKQEVEQQEVDTPMIDTPVVGEHSSAKDSEEEYESESAEDEVSQAAESDTGVSIRAEAEVVKNQEKQVPTNNEDKGAEQRTETEEEHSEAHSGSDNGDPVDEVSEQAVDKQIEKQASPVASLAKTTHSSSPGQSTTNVLKPRSNHSRPTTVSRNGMPPASGRPRKTERGFVRVPPKFSDHTNNVDDGTQSDSEGEDIAPKLPVRKSPSPVVFRRVSKAKAPPLSKVIVAGRGVKDESEEEIESDSSDDSSDDSSNESEEEDAVDAEAELKRKLAFARPFQKTLPIAQKSISPSDVEEAEPEESAEESDEEGEVEDEIGSVEDDDQSVTSSVISSASLGFETRSIGTPSIKGGREASDEIEDDEAMGDAPSEQRSEDADDGQPLADTKEVPKAEDNTHDTDTFEDHLEPLKAEGAANRSRVKSRKKAQAKGQPISAKPTVSDPLANVDVTKKVGEASAATEPSLTEAEAEAKSESGSDSPLDVKPTTETTSPEVQSKVPSTASPETQNNVTSTSVHVPESAEPSPSIEDEQVTALASLPSRKLTKKTSAAPKKKPLPRGKKPAVKMADDKSSTTEMANANGTGGASQSLPDPHVQDTIMTDASPIETKAERKKPVRKPKIAIMTNGQDTIKKNVKSAVRKPEIKKSGPQSHAAAAAHGHDTVMQKAESIMPKLQRKKPGLSKNATDEKLESNDATIVEESLKSGSGPGSQSKTKAKKVPVKSKDGVTAKSG